MKMTSTKNHPYIDKLVERIGISQASQAIGLSTNGLAPSNTKNGVRMAYEIAAKQIWLERYEPKPTNGSAAHYMVKVPAEKQEAVETMLKAFDCKFVQWRF